MSYTIQPYDESRCDKWDDFVMNHAMNGTFLQTRRFLNYHPEGRFTDASVMVYNGQELCAVVPAAAQTVDGKRMLRSHHKGENFFYLYEMMFAKLIAIISCCVSVNALHT